MKRAYDFLTKEIGIKYGDSLVVGVSGGPDSMALLKIVNDIKKEMDIEVICAHVNHNVRVESAGEQIFIENYCHQNGIGFIGMKIEEYGEDNFHNEARSKRYQFFERVLKQYNAKYLLTAHHGDDLMETILMRLVRGSTLKGYSGFSKIVDMKSYLILRPLIEYTKEEILDYCIKNNIKYVLDKSNTKDKYTRNRYRKYILPVLKKENKNVHEKFLKFSHTLLEYNDYIDKQIKRELKKVYKQNILNIEEFLNLDKVVRQEIIYSILESIYQDDLMLICDSHVDLIMDLIKSKKVNTYICLPNNIRVAKSYNTLIFVQDKIKDCDYEIDITDNVNLPNGKNIEIIENSNIKSNYICRLSNKDIKLPLRVRNRKSGDKIYVKGMLGSKKIKDIFINEKISMEERNLWPIVVDSEDKVVWIPGIKKSKFDREKSENYDIILRYY